MAIRIRKVDGRTVALCAAKTKPKKGDIYIDDNNHYALATKFACDAASTDWFPSYFGDEELIERMVKEEKNHKKYWKGIFKKIENNKSRNAFYKKAFKHQEKFANYNKA